ncbi:MAG TPA: sialidase family protein [Solirubrobacteraceae bacterium]|nr:sialidase family protein [Solirubrobacteraceae bacterium]
MNARRRAGAPALAVVIAVLIVALAASAPATADPGLTSNLQPVSGATPFPNGCAVPGERTRDAAAEPAAAVNPQDPRNIVVAYQQDRFPIDGGALSNVIATSKDGGKTFRQVLVPGVSRCTGGADERTSDPWVSFGPDGTLYMANLTFSETQNSSLGLAGPSQLSASVSHDGGLTFDAPVAVQGFDDQYNDRESVTADPRRPGVAYYAFVLRYGSLGESGISMLSRTTNGGRIWSAPAPIYAPGPGLLPDPDLIKVTPAGSVLHVFTVDNASPFLPDPLPKIRFDVMVARSTDGGQSFAAPVKVADTAPFPPIDPGTQKVVRSYPLVSTDVAPDGTIYVTWNEIPTSNGGASTIWFARSTDDGRSFSAPGVVAQVSNQAFLASIAVAGDGTVGVTWDDFRNATPGAHSLATDVWYAHSHDRGHSWTESHVAGPFDMLTASETGSSGIKGLFVGDYQSLAGLPDGFAAAFAQSRPQATVGVSDIFFARLGHGEPGAAAAPGSAATGPAIALSVRPRRVRAGALRRFRFTARAAVPGATGAGRWRGLPIAGASIRFAGHRARTDRRGRARIRVRLTRPGRRRAIARKQGFVPARATVRVSR